MQALIEESIEKNVQIFKAKQMARCHQEAMEAAIALADSILIAEALMAKDSSHLIKPIKPQKPAVKLLADSVPVKPLFEKMKADTLHDDNFENGIKKGL